MSNYTGLRGQPNPLELRIAELEAENEVQRVHLEKLLAELATLKARMQELQWENERLFVSLKGKGIRERLYHALKELDELTGEEE